MKKFKKAIFLIFLSTAHSNADTQTLSFQNYATQSSPSSSVTITQASNGILINLKGDGSDNVWVMSDVLSVTEKTEWYVTLVCSNTILDYGLEISRGVSPSAYFGQSLVKRPLSGSNNFLTDVDTIFYPAQVSGTVAGSYSYRVALGETVQQILDPTVGTYFAYTNTRTAPTSSTISSLNCPGGSTGPGTTSCNNLKSGSAPFYYGFEVLNNGQAIFCVQSAAQYANGNNCDNQATTAESCTYNSGNLGSTFSKTGSECTLPGSYRSAGACVTSSQCPVGTIAYDGLDNHGSCVPCTTHLVQGTCYTAPATSGSSSSSSTSSTSSTSSSSASNTETISSPSATGMTAGQVAGIIVSGVFVLVLLISVILYILAKKGIIPRFWRWPEDTKNTYEIKEKPTRQIAITEGEGITHA